MKVETFLDIDFQVKNNLFQVLARGFPCECYATEQQGVYISRYNPLSSKLLIESDLWCVFGKGDGNIETFEVCDITLKYSQEFLSCIIEKLVNKFMEKKLVLGNGF